MLGKNFLNCVLYKKGDKDSFESVEAIEKKEINESWEETRNKRTAEIIREIKEADKQAEKCTRRISNILNSKPVRVGASGFLTLTFAVASGPFAPIVFAIGGKATSKILFSYD